MTDTNTTVNSSDTDYKAIVQESSGYSLTDSILLRIRTAMELHFDPPCPWLATNCPYPLCCCCCTLPRSTRQHFAIYILYAPSYVIVYFLIIAITLMLCLYDVVIQHMHVTEEPHWFIVLGVCGVFLVIFDITVHV